MEEKSPDSLIYVTDRRRRGTPARERIRWSSVHTRLTTWAHYTTLIWQLKDTKKALCRALQKAPSGGPDAESVTREEFDLWVKHDLWPPPELEHTPYGRFSLFQEGAKGETRDL